MRHTFLGKSNPDTLRAMEDLAVMCYRQGRCEDAISWMSRCVEGRERVLVEEHKDTMRAMRLLAQYIEERDGARSEDVNTSNQMLWNKARRPDHLFLDAMEKLNQKIHDEGQPEDDLEEDVDVSQETHL
jgi:Tetratricopeptide repeat